MNFKYNAIYQKVTSFLSETVSPTVTGKIHLIFPGHYLSCRKCQENPPCILHLLLGNQLMRKLAITLESGHKK
jgi:hypothetical protein